MPVQSCCFARKTNCFLTLSSSCLLKLPNVPFGQVLVSQSTFNLYFVIGEFDPGGNKLFFLITPCLATCIFPLLIS